jgi:N-formylglutamate amidohydrolase
MLPYHLRIPNRILYPIIATLPHSGTCIPDAVAERFRQPRPSLTNMDWHLDKLYAFLPDLGITVLQATQSRYVVDVNRALKTPLSGAYKTCVVYEENTFGRPLYDVPPTPAEINQRIDLYYHPFHDRLTSLLEETIQRAGKAYLLDLHSFFIQTSSDICLGNQRNRTSSRALLNSVEKAFCDSHFSVVKNEGLLGGYITQHYGNKQTVESLQIELRYPTYLDQAEWGEEEGGDWESAHFHEAQVRLKTVFANIVAFIDNPN